MNPVRRSAALLCLPALLAGCATATRSDPADQPAYRYVMETGSNIPRKVKKGRSSDGILNIEKGGSRTLETLQRDQTIRNMRRDRT